MSTHSACRPIKIHFIDGGLQVGVQGWINDRDNPSSLCDDQTLDLVEDDTGRGTGPSKRSQLEDQVSACVHLPIRVHSIEVQKGNIAY